MKHDIVARNNVRISGEGSRVMLFAHGFGCDQNMWRYVAPAFEKEYRIVLFDYVGSGKSDLKEYDPQRYATLDGYVADVLEICEALKVEDAIFVGHSVSSIIGMLAAIQEPRRFSRLVLVGPSPCYTNHPPDYHGGFERQDLEGLLEMMERNFLGWASFLAPVVMSNPERPELTQELEGSFCSTDPKIARQFAEATFFSDNRHDLPKVPVPSLILQCTEDAIAPRSVGEYVHRHTPASTLHILEATGHCPHMSHPHATVRAIQEYLAEPAREAGDAGHGL